MAFLMNSWYAAAWSSEVAEKPISRRIADRPVAIYRTADGQAVALEDRCPHRFAKLSMGVVKGDAIECPYHGLRFAASGVCVASPFSDEVPAKARVTSFPAVERHGLLWLWLGEPEKADSSRIVDLSDLERLDVWRPASGYMHVGVNYELMIDNLLDLSHAEFIHSGNLGPGNLAQGKFEARYVGDTVEYAISVSDTTPPPFFDLITSSEGRHVDFRVIGRWDAPGVVWLESRTRYSDDRKSHVTLRGVHIVTPETLTSSHYFYSGLRTARTEDEKLQAMIEAGLEAAFANEDKPMVEAAQSNMSTLDLFAMDPLILPMDGAAVRVRRRLKQLIDREQEEPANEPAPDVRADANALAC